MILKLFKRHRFQCNECYLHLVTNTMGNVFSTLLLTILLLKIAICSYANIYERTLISVK